MKIMTLEQLTWAQAIIINNKEPKESVTTSTQQTCNDADVLKGGIICFKCSSSCHMAKD